MAEPTIDFTDKVAIVTGSARGIGRGIADELARRGAKVVLNDVDPDVLQVAVDELRDAGAEVVGVTADVSTSKGGALLTEVALERWGRVDILVNNAGICRDALFHKMSELQWDQVQGTHVRALFTVTQPVVKHLIARRKADPTSPAGSIVCISSTSGLAGNVGQTNYSAAKAGVLGFTLALAKELERYGTRVNAVAPTAWTRLVSAIPDQVLLKHVGEEGLTNMKARKPEHIAPVVCFLASDAAEGVTGQFVRASGHTVGLFGHPRSKVVESSEDWSVEAVGRAFDGFTEHLEPLSGLGDL